MQKEIKRIPYTQWSNSQLSIARHYWGRIIINEKEYEYDREIVKQMVLDEKNWEYMGKLYKPDLVFYWKLWKK